MADALTIDFAMTNSDRVEKAFARFAALTGAGAKNLQVMAHVADAATAAYKKLNSQVARFNKLTSTGTGLVPRFHTSSATATTTAANQARVRGVQGPFQRQASLAHQFAQASSSGDWRKVADVGLAQARNEKEIAKVNAPEKTIKGKFADLIKTSRFSVNAGGATLMPLVGKAASILGEALGPEVAALAGPIGLAAMAATAAAKGIWDLAQNAATAATAFTNAGLQMGNIGAGASTADRFGRASGLTPAETAGVASSIQAAISAGGIGRAMGLQAHMFNIGGPFGDQDRSKLVAQAFNYMRSLKSLSARESFARATGSEALLPGTMVSDKQLARGSGDAAVTSQIFDEKFQREAADFQYAVGRVQDAFGNLMGALGKPMVDKFTGLLNNLADTFNNWAVWLDSPTGKRIIDTLSAQFGGRFNDSADDFIDKWDSKMNANDAQRQKDEELKKNTDAIKDLTGKIPGAYGKDTDGRLGRALPGAAGFEANFQARQEMVKNARRLGAF